MRPSLVVELESRVAEGASGGIAARKELRELDALVFLDVGIAISRVLASQDRLPRFLSLQVSMSELNIVVLLIVK